MTLCVPQPLRPASGVRSVWFCGTRSSSPSLSWGVCFQTPKGSARAVRPSWPCGCCPAQPVLSTPLTKWLLDVCVQKDWVARRARSGQGILGVHGAYLLPPGPVGAPGSRAVTALRAKGKRGLISAAVRAGPPGSASRAATALRVKGNRRLISAAVRAGPPGSASRSRPQTTADGPGRALPACVLNKGASEPEGRCRRGSSWRSLYPWGTLGKGGPHLVTGQGQGR